MKRIKQILDTAIRIAAAFYLMQNFTALFSPESEIRMTRVYGILPEEFLALFVFLSSGLFTSCGLFVFLSAKRKAAFFLSSIILFAGIISKIYSDLIDKNIELNALEISNFISENSEWLDIMENEIKKNSK